MGSSGSDSPLFSMLPQRRVPWYEFVFSYGTQAVIVAIFVWVPLLHPEILETPKQYLHLTSLIPVPPPVNHAPQRQLPPPKPVLIAKLDPPPAALRLPTPQPAPKPKVEDAPAPEVKIAEKKLDLPPAKSAGDSSNDKDEQLSNHRKLSSANHAASGGTGADRRLRRSQRRPRKVEPRQSAGQHCAGRRL